MSSEQPARRGPNIVLLAIIGVVLLGVIAVLATRGGGSSTSTNTSDGSSSASASTSTKPETRPVAVTGNPLPQLADTGADAAVGMQAPVLSGEMFDGTKLSIGDKGPAVIVFVAHWCPHCRREVPFLKSYFDLHGLPKGLMMYSVATSIDASAPNYPPSKWLEKEGWTVPTLVDDDNDAAAAAYGLSAFPYFVAIDKDGKIVARTTGELEAPALEKLFDAARSG